MIDAKMRNCERRIAEQEHRLESISQSLRTRQDSDKLPENLTVSLKALQGLRRLVMKEVEEDEKGRVDSVLPAAEVDAYGWIIAFGLGGVIGIASYWLRTSLEESQEFRKMRSHVAKRPFRQLLRSHPAQIAVAVGVAAIDNGSNSLLFVFPPSCLSRVLHYSADSLSIALNAGIAAMAVSLFFFAWHRRIFCQALWRKHRSQDSKLRPSLEMNRACLAGDEHRGSVWRPAHVSSVRRFR